MAQACLNFGQRVQKSVFECQVNEEELYRLREQLLNLIDLKEDRLRLYRIPEPVEKSIEEYGCHRSVDFEKPLIV